MLQMTSIFAVLKLFTTCNAIATSPTESPSGVSTNSGAFSFKVPNRGYSLTKAEMWKPTQMGSIINGF